jgi:hypothetical protein
MTARAADALVRRKASGVVKQSGLPHLISATFARFSGAPTEAVGEMRALGETAT